MANPEITNPENSLEQKMLEQQKDALRSATGLIDARIAASADATNALGERMPEEVRQLYINQANHLREQTQKLRDVVDEKTLLAMQKEILEVGLMQRLDLILQITGGAKPTDTVDTNAELFRLRQQGFDLIKNTDVSQLMLDYFHRHHATTLEAKVRAHIEAEKGLDTYAALLRMSKGENLEEEEWKVVDHYLRALMRGNATGEERNLALSLAASLNPFDRRELLDRLSEEPGFPDLVEALLRNNYLTVDQVQDFIGKKINTLTEGKAKKKEIEQWLKLKELLDSPSIKVSQENWEEFKRKATIELSQRSFGNKNIARHLLSFGNILKGAAAINGAAGMLANIMIDMKEPWLLPTNMGFIISATEFAGGLELTQGLEGLVRAPSKILAGVAKDKNEEVAQSEETLRTNISTSFGNSPKAARLFYTLEEKITQLYQKKKQDEKNTHPTITFKELGLSWEKLPEEYKKDPVEFYEKMFANWAYLLNESLGLKTHTGHRQTMVEMALKRHVEAPQDDVKVLELLAPETEKNKKQK